MKIKLNRDAVSGDLTKAEFEQRRELAIYIVDGTETVEDYLKGMGDVEYKHQ